MVHAWRTGKTMKSMKEFWRTQPLGEYTDKELALRLGVSRRTVWYARRALGIPVKRERTRHILTLPIKQWSEDADYWDRFNELRRSISRSTDNLPPQPVRYVIEGTCWICISHKWEQGHKYPYVGLNGRSHSLGAMVLLLRGFAVGQYAARHTCDNYGCINPAHIIHGTHADNMRDAVERGRAALGERHAFAKLTKSEAAEILASGDRIAELARRYGVSSSTISDIKERRTWRRL